MQDLSDSIYNTDVQMLWVYGDLSKLERLCISSFIHHNYNVNLWTYGKVSNAPAGTILRDANEILPESRVFLNRAGSYAAFSDIFRYTLLNTLGGLYCDTDVIALLPFQDLQSTPFLVTERQQGRHDFMINGNVAFNPTPSRGNIIDMALAVAERFPIEKIRWAEIGPLLMTYLVLLQAEHGYDIQLPDFANCFNYWDCPDALLTPGTEIPPGANFLHCYNEAWRRAEIDKNAPYPPGSLMDHFEKMFLQEPAMAAEKFADSPA